MTLAFEVRINEHSDKRWPLFSLHTQCISIKWAAPAQYGLCINLDI